MDWSQVGNQIFLSAITACFTIFGGVLVLLIGQFGIRFFIEPIHQQAKLRTEIFYSLSQYGTTYEKPTDTVDVEEAASVLRRQASQLRATLWAIPWYGVWELVGVVPKRGNILKASDDLISWAGLWQNADRVSIETRQKLIGELLRIK